MSNPKLRLWAKLISKGRYDNYDEIPPIPLLQDSVSTSVKKKKGSVSDALVEAATAVAKVFKSQPNASSQKSSSPSRVTAKLSPMKYAQLHRTSLEDLQTLKALYEDNVISQTEFAEEKDRILSTLKSLHDE